MIKKEKSEFDNILLFYWYHIELYNELVKFDVRYRWKRNYYKYLLKIKLGVDSIDVYND